MPRKESVQCWGIHSLRPWDAEKNRKREWHVLRYSGGWAVQFRASLSQGSPEAPLWEAGEVVGACAVLRVTGCTMENQCLPGPGMGLERC